MRRTLIPRARAPSTSCARERAPGARHLRAAGLRWRRSSGSRASGRGCGIVAVADRRAVARRGSPSSAVGQVELRRSTAAAGRDRARAASRAPPPGSASVSPARPPRTRSPSRRSSTTQRSGSPRGRGEVQVAAGRRRRGARAAPAGSVAEALTTSRSPARRWSGRSRKPACASAAVRGRATISRTSSRARPRASGGAWPRGAREPTRRRSVTAGAAASSAAR